MAEHVPFLPGLSPVGGKPVHMAFDGGRLTSDAGVLVLAEIERRLGLAERLAGCIEDRRAPERVRHGLAEMIRFRALMIAAGYEDANDCDALRDDPAFKMAVGRLPETGSELCSQPTMCRLENLPTKTALKRMMAAMVELFCDSFAQVPRRIVLDIDDTEDRVHGRQQLALFHAHYDSRCFLPIHGYVFGLAGNKVLLAKVAHLAEGAALDRVANGAVKARRHAELRYAAKTWNVQRQVIARIEASAQGSDCRFVVTNLTGSPRWLYEEVYCARGEMENRMYGRLPPRKCSLRRSGTIRSAAAMYPASSGHLAVGLHEIRDRRPDYQVELKALRFSRALPTPVRPVMPSRRRSPSQLVEAVVACW